MNPSMADLYDIFIIGGGINGCGIARDAAGRGYKVGLCEAGDFASGTSSASTKLIHGGLRYLEHYEFRLVREALMEREVLWKMAPHIIWPLRFVLTHHTGLRPQWMLRAGLFLYDHLGGRKILPASRKIRLRSDVSGKALQARYTVAFEYSDLWVEDSRLVVLNAIDASARGADIRSRTRVISAKSDAGIWKIHIEDALTGEQSEVHAKTIVNAAGPWADEVLRNVFGQNDAHNVRLVRGSHIVIDKKFQHDKCYVFQNSDNRIVFAIPYELDYTLIGTTDMEHADLEDRPEISPEEIDYLCRTASEYFAEPVTVDDIVWTYSGVRPLYDDGVSAAQEATRDYVLQREDAAGQAALINIFGGKITTYRKLAEAVLAEIDDVIGSKGAPWTRNSTLPGGGFSPDETSAHVHALAEKFPCIKLELAARLFKNYGLLAEDLLAGVSKKSDLGTHFGAGLYEKEVRYLMANEWAMKVDDVIFRRTKLGIKLNQRQVEKISKFMHECQISN
jgi:glycerol-3-phosphate dehydrogenase